MEPPQCVQRADRSRGARETVQELGPLFSRRRPSIVTGRIHGRVADLPFFE